MRNDSPASTTAPTLSTNKRILIAYYSRTGNTREVANQIHGIGGGDIFEIQTANPYPDDYEAMVKQAWQEQQSRHKPPLKSKVQDIGSYDVIFIGFPIWGMNLPSPVRSILSEYDLSGKTIVPFCTHGGYGKGQSFDTVKGLVPRSNLVEGFAIEGKKVGTAQSEVKRWLTEIKVTEQGKSS